MKILVLNGNTSESITRCMLDLLRGRCSESVQLVGATAPFGLPYVSDWSAAAIAGHAVLGAVRAAVAAEETPFDACYYACFGEPGIAALRAENGFPVIGMAEASLLTALQLGGRFSIVTTGPGWLPMLREWMRGQALDARCAGIGVLDGDGLRRAASREDGLAMARAAVAAAIARDAPDVVIVAGAALAGYGAALDREAPVPVVDSLFAGFEQTLALARLGLRRRGPSAA